MRSFSRALVAALLLPLATAVAQSRGARPVKPAWPDEGPVTWAPRPTAPDITANDLRTRLYGIADDSMQGRGIGAIGNFKTTAYIADEFRRLGLTPAGENGTYFQDLPWGQSQFAPATTRLSAAGRALQLRTEFVPLPANGIAGTSGTAQWTDAGTVFAGRWGDTAVVLDPAVFRGKVAVFLTGPGAPVPSQPRPNVLRCDSVPDRFGVAAVLKWEQEQAALRASRPAVPVPPRDRRAVAAGATGILIIALDSMPEALRTAILSPRGMMQPTAPTAPSPALGVLSSAAATALFGRTMDGLAVGAQGAALSAAWDYTWTPAPHASRNVIAVLPGSDPTRREEYVLVGAHNDHVGFNAAPVDHDSLRAVNTVTRRQGANDPVCRPTPDQQRRIDSLIAAARAVRPIRRDSIFNGADDDGSGTVVLLEIAERFARQKPARSIVFVSHQGEESGLLGSRWFVDHPTIPLAKVVAAHNMDMVGKGRVEQVRFGGPNSVQTLGSRRLSRDFGDIIDSVNAISREPMAIDRSWDVVENPLNRFCRSDQVSYVRKDIPVTYFSLGYAQDYHQVTDEPQYIDYDHAARLGRFLFDVMWAISERKDKPSIAGPDPRYPRC
jgi:hypothetical protein